MLWREFVKKKEISIKKSKKAIKENSKKIIANNNKKNVNTFNKKIRKKNNNKINRFKVLVVATILLVVFSYISLEIYKLINKSSKTVAVKMGTISKEETTIGYIIRDEIIVKGENYKNGMEQIADEGQKTAKGESVFRYYSKGEEELKNKIKELDEEIQKNMENSDEQLFSTDTKLLDSQINEKLMEINTLNNIQAIQEYKKTLNNYITKKAQIAGELSPKGSQLKKLIEERNNYGKQLSSESEYVVSPKSGVISYRIDGLEETLNTNDFSKYNKEFLNSLNLKTGKIIPTSTEQGKIVNNFVCYIACTSKSKEAKNAKIGDNIYITLPNSKTISAEIYYIIEENEGEVTLVLKFSNNIDEILSYRKISLDIIWWNSKGYKVPNSAIITENNLNYVIRTKRGYLDRVLVKVIKQTDSHTIVTNYSSSEIDDLSVDSKTKTSILLYDELILNPTQEQINSTK